MIHFGLLQSLQHDPRHVPTLYCYSQLLGQLSQQSGSSLQSEMVREINHDPLLCDTSHSYVFWLISMSCVSSIREIIHWCVTGV